MGGYLLITNLPDFFDIWRRKLKVIEIEQMAHLKEKKVVWVTEFCLRLALLHCIGKLVLWLLQKLLPSNILDQGCLCEF